MLMSRLKDRAPQLAAAFFALLCLLMAAKLIDRVFLSGWNLGLAAQQVAPLRDTSRLVWFKNPSTPQTVTSAEPVATDDQYQNASINAQLLGVLIAGNELAFAAIQTPQRPDGVYGIGDEIAANVILLRVEPTRVVVRERGVERQILLKPLAENGQLADDDLIETMPQSGGATSGFSLSGVMGATPINVTGEGIGLRLDALDAEVAAMSGLEQGDIVLAVDGRPVAQLMANPAVFTRLSEETALVVRVRRADQDLELTVNARAMRERILPEIGQGMVQ